MSTHDDVGSGLGRSALERARAGTGSGIAALLRGVDRVQQAGERHPEPAPTAPAPAVAAEPLGAHRVVERAWLIATGDALLHYAHLDIHQLTALELDQYVDGPVQLACERPAASVSLPSTSASMVAARCPGCCTALSYPTGNGSPARDQRCTTVLRSRGAS